MFSLCKQWQVQFFNGTPWRVDFIGQIDRSQLEKRYSNTLNRFSLSDRESDEWFGSGGGFSLRSWKGNIEESRPGVTLSWQTPRPIEYTSRDEVYSTTLSVQVYRSLSEQTPFYIRRHPPSNVSLRMDEHIRESVQRYTVGQRERRGRKDEAYVQPICTWLIDTQGCQKNLHYYGIESCYPV